MIKSDLLLLLLVTNNHLSRILATATFDFMPLHLAIEIIHNRWVLVRLLALRVAQAHRSHLVVVQVLEGLNVLKARVGWIFLVLIDVAVLQLICFLCNLQNTAWITTLARRPDTWQFFSLNLHRPLFSFHRALLPIFLVLAQQFNLTSTF